MNLVAIDLTKMLIAENQLNHTLNGRIYYIKILENGGMD
ncbi:hypothetical protein ABIC37_003696 [Priestia megaterium]